MKKVEDMGISDKRRWLVNYLLIKNNLVAENTEGHVLLTKAEDLEDIIYWSYDFIEQAFHRIYPIVGYILEGKYYGEDASLCPWCVRLLAISDCENCGYGKRHGECDKKTSRYQIAKRCSKEFTSFSSLVTSNKERFACLYPKIKDKIVKGPVDLIKILVADGYQPDKSGNWQKPGRLGFNCKMWAFCGKQPSKDHRWPDEWLEES